MVANNNDWRGAFGLSSSGDGGFSFGRNGDVRWIDLRFNAAYSSSVYSDNSNVTPMSACTVFLIKY